MIAKPQTCIYARALIGVFIVYALLFQGFFLGLTNSALALDQHALCITDQLGQSERSDPAPALPQHDCSCPALCHSGFVPPAAPAIATSRIDHLAHYLEFEPGDLPSHLAVTPSARGPPLAA